MSLKEFILSKVFLKNLAIAALVVIAVILGLLLWMNLYTRHGQARPVPSFIGLTQEQVANLARKSKLRYEVIDSVYTSAVPRGCVVEQNPEPGFKVKKWRNIILTVNAYNPEMVKVPNLVDLPIRQAIQSIESSGFKMGETRYKPDLSINVVLEQSCNGKPIFEGDSLQKGSVIDLVLGKGLSNQRAPVPDLIGMNLNQAKNEIVISSFSLGTYVYDNSIRNAEDTINALVFKQNPEYKEDATLQLGSAIYLWLTVGSTKLPVDSTMIMNDTIQLPDTLSLPTN
ncbi:MAG TPA: PASTA domain-containing protein [Bacteroidales bacterium]|nr:PASTA domain-containing protein [Bacteroidales bacterium]